MLDPRSQLSLESSAVHTRRGGQAAVPDALPDLLLVERARAGDARAIEVLTRRYGRRLFRVTRSVLADEDGAELAVQEALLNAFGELNRHPLSGKFAAWLTRIAFGEARARRGNARAPAGGAPRPLPAEVALDEGDARERRELEHAIECLPEVFRAVFVLRIVEGISGIETAASLGVHETTVRTRIYRAQRRLGSEVMRRLRLAPALLELEPERLERIVRRVLAQRLHGSMLTISTSPP
jgi:RNA polymerase sigma-70 factor (ECF subfamily)